MRLRIIAALMAFSLIPICAQAQETTSAVMGKVVDAQGLAVPGATVTVTGPQGVKTVTTDSQGGFHVPFLTPGTYSVRAEMKGFTPVERKNLSLSLGKPVDVTIKLQISGVTEAVTVIGGETLDRTSTTTGATITSEQLQKIPVGRTVSDTLYLAPGVSSSGTAGRANPSISGGSALDNQYVIDGTNVTNMGYGALGSYSIIFGSLGQATPFDFIQEVQVKTGGYEAEFGQATGGVMNVITKSGTNSIKGSAFVYGRPTGTEGNWRQFQSSNGSVQFNSSSIIDGGAEGGGPILKNRLFVFGAYDPGQEVLSIRAPDGFPLNSLGNIDRVRTTNVYSGKVTWQMAPQHRLDASFFGDPSTGDLGPQRMSALLVTDASSFSSLKYGGHNQAISYHGVLGGSWLIEGVFAHSLNRIEETPAENTWRVTDRRVVPNVITGGIGFFEAGNRSINNQYLVKATKAWGKHELKAGVEFDDVEYSQINQRTGPTFLAADGRQTATGAQVDILPDVNFGQIFNVVRANFNSGRTTEQFYTNFFVQDTWRVSNRLTINPGLRYEQQSLSGSLVQDFKLSNNWAPRIGATYMLTGDGKTRVYGNFGLYYSRMPNDLAARALSADDGISRADYFDANLTQPIPNGVVTQVPGGGQITNHFVVAGTGADTIDPDAKLGYTNEFLVGFERQLWANTSIDIRYIHRYIGRVLEDVANAPMVAYDLGLPGTESVEYILTNPSVNTPILASAQFLGASFVDPVHNYDAVELVFNRRLAKNWSMIASYRWSKLEGNFEGFYRDDNGQSDPGITSLYDFPTNDPSYVGIGTPQFGYEGDIRFLGDVGTLPLDRPHLFKVFSNYMVGNNLSFGVGFSIGSGTPLTGFAANPQYSNGGEIPTTPRGAGFLTTDGLTSAEEQRGPIVSQLDLQVSYGINFGKGGQRLTLLADGFNVLNRRAPLGFDQWTQLTFPIANPDVGNPISQVLPGRPPTFQPPFAIRFGARFAF
jgi:outer membrane receptor protein involved in Fe transport